MYAELRLQHRRIRLLQHCQGPAEPGLDAPPVVGIDIHQPIIIALLVIIAEHQCRFRGEDHAVTVSRLDFLTAADIDRIVVGIRITLFTECAAGMRFDAAAAVAEVQVPEPVFCSDGAVEYAESGLGITAIIIVLSKIGARISAGGTLRFVGSGALCRLEGPALSQYLFLSSQYTLRMPVVGCALRSTRRPAVHWACRSTARAERWRPDDRAGSWHLAHERGDTSWNRT